MSDSLSKPARQVRAEVPRWLGVSSAWSWRLLLVAGFVAVFALALYELRVVVLPIYIALLATTVLLPPVSFLQRRGMHPALATMAVFLIVVLVVAGAIYLIASPVSDQFKDLGPQVSGAIDRAQDWLVTGPIGLEKAQLDKYVHGIGDQLRANSAGLRAGVVGGATIAAEVVTGTVLSIVLTFFFVKDGDRLVRGVIERLPVDRRPIVQEACSQVFRTLGGYLRGVLFTGIVDGVIIGIGLWIIGVPLVLPLALLTIFAAFFPVVGATVAGALAAAVALFNGGVGDMVIVIILVLAVQQLEGHILQPMIMSRAVQLHPVVVLLSLGIGAILAGLLGAFLAVPVAAMIGSVVRTFDQHRAFEAEPQPDAATPA